MPDWLYATLALLIPFAGTSLGAAMVFLMKKDINELLEKILLGFAAGVMVAASVWSLLIPSLEMSSSLGKLSFIPAAVGFLLGIGFLLLVDVITPHLHLKEKEPEGLRSNFGKTKMMLLAVTIHNIPEGMAVGVVIAGFLSKSADVTALGALSLAIGIAIQNFPEGAIISMPLCAEGSSKGKSFFFGVLSGAVEPLAAGLVIGLTSLFLPILPYMLSFAAGAMIYVVVEELIPEAQKGKHTNLVTIGFAVGFIIMMVLDVALS